MNIGVERPDRTGCGGPRFQNYPMEEWCNAVFIIHQVVTVLFWLGYYNTIKGSYPKDIPNVHQLTTQSGSHSPGRHRRMKHCLVPSVCRNTLAVRQSSEYPTCGAEPALSGFPGAAGPYREASIVRVEAATGTAGRKRLSPVGGSAYGMPRNASTARGTSLLILMPIIVP